MLNVSANAQKKADLRDVLTANTAAEAAHLTASKKGETRWEGLYDCLSKAHRMRNSYVNVCEDEDARTGILEAAGISFETDFPTDSYWKRVFFYIQLLEPVRKFSKWAQAEREPLMLLLRERISILLSAFETRAEEDAAHGQLRAAFRATLSSRLLPDLTLDPPALMVRAMYLNPFVKFAEYCDGQNVEEIMSWCKASILDEMTNFLSDTDRRDYQGHEKEYLKLELDGFLLAHSVRQKSSLPRFEEQASALASFYKTKLATSATLQRVVRAYFSMPVASSKSETTFSYTGDVLTKKRNQLSVDLTEALTVVNDMTRQPNYSFERVFEGVKALGHEYEDVKRAAAEEKNAKIAALQAEVAALLEEKDDMSDDKSPAGKPETVFSENH